MPGSKSKLIAHGKITVTRVCAVKSCEEIIDSPYRFCVAHDNETPAGLKPALFNAGSNPRIRHPAVQAIVEYWQGVEPKSDV